MTLFVSKLQRSYREVRGRSVELVEPLTAEDQSIQSMPDASPTKWHLAHTTWFFETVVLMKHAAGYVPFNKKYQYLFNSYYEALGPRHARAMRGLLSRPSVEEVLRYRHHVDEAMLRLIATPDVVTLSQLEPVIVRGLHHEQQHQELLLTDILHAFSCNPMLPAYANVPAIHADEDISREVRAVQWLRHAGGVVDIGFGGQGFAFDNESPRHKVLLRPYEIADHLVSNGEFADFVAVGGYERPEFWLSDGWAMVQREGLKAPAYWIATAEPTGAPCRLRVGKEFGLQGLHPLVSSAPVCHISFYEAAAYAEWAGARLPTEFEWEAAFLTPGIQNMTGHVWQWTRSSYDPYPGFRPLPGVAGEYNGKFMVGQQVLRGGSIATPKGHTRASYRNFFPPAARWHSQGCVLSETSEIQALQNAERELIEAIRQSDYGRDLLAGLSRSPRSIAPKYFYDAAGSALFERICEVPEYYPSRTELDILRSNASQIIGQMGAHANIIEFGAGSLGKIRVLLDAFPPDRAPDRFIPVDISAGHLEDSAQRLRRAYPCLEVLPIAGDYMKPEELADIEEMSGRKVGFFPGSTIGNFTPHETAAFLRRAQTMLAGGGLLVGVDLVKDANILHQAYNDSEGVTAAFNLNLLVRANAELRADFDLGGFVHNAFYNEAMQRIEMHLVSLRRQTVRVAGFDFRFDEGETIHTENSHKFTVDGFREIVAAAGFRPGPVWTDDAGLFSVHWLESPTATPMPR